MTATLKNADGYSVKVNVAEIFAGLGAEQVATKAVQKQVGAVDFLRDQLARSEGSRRSSRWKNSVRTAILPMPITGEKQTAFAARCREFVLEVAK